MAALSHKLSCLCLETNYDYLALIASVGSFIIRFLARVEISVFGFSQDFGMSGCIEDRDQFIPTFAHVPEHVKACDASRCESEKHYRIDARYPRGWLRRIRLDCRVQKNKSNQCESDVTK